MHLPASARALSKCGAPRAFIRSAAFVAVGAICCIGCRPASNSNVLSAREDGNRIASAAVAEAEKYEITHHFGVVHPRHRIAHVFHIRNGSQARETIKHVSRTCLCLATALSKDVLEPGDEANLTVEYTAPDRPSDDKRVLTLTFAEPHRAPLRLVVTATVRDVISADQTNVVFSDAAPNRRANAHLLVENFGDVDWQRFQAVTSARWLTVIPRRLDVRAARDAPRQAWDLRLVADPDNAGHGTHRAELRVQGDDLSPRAVPVTLVVTGPVAAIPADIFAGRVSAHQSLERTFMLRFANG